MPSGEFMEISRDKAAFQVFLKLLDNELQKRTDLTALDDEEKVRKVGIMRDAAFRMVDIFVAGSPTQ